MQYTCDYASPLGAVLLAADETGLTGLWFEGQKHYARGLDIVHEERETPVLTQAKRWLDQYFSGRKPDVEASFHLIGTPFQNDVWALLRAIPYGQITTYGEIARQLADKRGIAHLSAQAVGGVVGRNKLSIIVPCHRVVGADGSLTGYAGGVERKLALLKLEGVCVDACHAPAKGRRLARDAGAMGVTAV